MCTQSRSCWSTMLRTEFQPPSTAWALQVEWDKGHALAHLLGALGLDGADDVLPIYIGDDRCAGSCRQFKHLHAAAEEELCG
jgi:Trehalose-phosphatase